MIAINVAISSKNEGAFGYLVVSLKLISDNYVTESDVGEYSPLILVVDDLWNVVEE